MARGFKSQSQHRSYHQVGTLAQQRGDLTAVEAWYQKALAIDEALW